MGASTADCIQQLAESIPDGQQPIPAEKQETAASRGLVALFVCPALLSEALFSLSSLVLKEQRYAIMMPAAFNGTSIRQVEFFQQSGVSRILVQALQKGVHFRLDQIVTMRSGSSVQPLKRFVGLVSASINLGDQVLTACMIFLN